MENTKIGTATLLFTEAGTVETAMFTPEAMSIPFMGPDLRLTGTFEDVEQIHNKADEVFATWFNRMNEIELADREKYTIKSNLVQCDKFTSGKPQFCKIEYVFEKL